MAGAERLVTAGVIGRSHGLDGSCHVRNAQHPLERGAEVSIAGEMRTVEHRKGSAAQPIVRFSGITSPEAVRELRGELVLVREHELPLAEGEWLAGDLVGCEVVGIGRVTRVIAAPSCDVLEVDGTTLIPFTGDAIRSVDAEGGRIQADLAFLGLESR